MNALAESVRRGLRQALAYAEGKADERAYRVHVPEKIDVKAVREKLDMIQGEFAQKSGYPL